MCDTCDIKAEETIRYRLDQLRSADQMLRESVKSGEYAKISEEIRTIQCKRHTWGWKIYLCFCTVVCSIRERHFLRLLGNVAKGNLNAVKVELLRSDRLKQKIGVLESAKQAAGGDVQQCVEKQQNAVLAIMDAYHSAKKKVLLFMAPYFSRERLADGYFQRVQAIDRMIPEDHLRIYASWLDADSENGLPQVCIWDDAHIEIRYPHPDPINDERIHQIARRAEVVYHHSITFANELVTRDTEIRKAFDMHGAYPEELRMYGRDAQAAIDEQQEKLAMEYGQCLICVTQSMACHLAQKYGKIPEHVIILPIFDEDKLHRCMSLKKTQSPKSTVVYAGGMQKWQNVEKMQEAIHWTEGKFQFRIFTPEPDIFWKKWKYARKPREIQVCKKSPDAVVAAYAMCTYGFLLREDIVVNSVACPTKLVEYLAAGIIPILDSPNIGDFVQDGMKYVSLSDFVSGRLPTEAEGNAYVSQNIEVVHKLENRYQQGKLALCAWLEQD